MIRRRRNKSETVEVPKVEEAPVAIAGPDELKCPTNATHQRVRLYDIYRNVGHAVCDDCGQTWEVEVSYHVDLTLFLLMVAEGLLNAPKHPSDTGQVIVMDCKDARYLAETLQRLVKDAPRTLTAEEVRRHMRPQRRPAMPAAASDRPSLAAGVFGGIRQGAANLMDAFGGTLRGRRNETPPPLPSAGDQSS